MSTNREQRASSFRFRLFSTATRRDGSMYGSWIPAASATAARPVAGAAPVFSAVYSTFSTCCLSSFVPCAPAGEILSSMLVCFGGDVYDSRSNKRKSRACAIERGEAGIYQGSAHGELPSLFFPFDPRKGRMAMPALLCWVGCTLLARWMGFCVGIALLRSGGVNPHTLNPHTSNGPTLFMQKFGVLPLHTANSPIAVIIKRWREACWICNYPKWRGLV